MSSNISLTPFSYNITNIPYKEKEKREEKTNSIFFSYVCLVGQKIIEL